MNDDRKPDSDGSPSRPASPVSWIERRPLFEPISARLRADPALWAPFFLAGWVLLVADLLRERDSLPTVSGVAESTVHVSYSIYPNGTTVTDRPLGALVDLQPRSFGYALGLETLAVAAIAVAGWLTMMRVSDDPFQPNRFLVYAGGVFLVDVLFRSLSAIGLEYTGESLLVGLALLAVVTFVFVRLFLVPVTVLREGGLVGPIGASWRYSRGHGFTLFGVIVCVGFGSWALAHVPTFGTVLSTTIAGTVHAVSLVVLYEQLVGDDEFDRS